jgi:hypothetical protein
VEVQNQLREDDEPWKIKAPDLMRTLKANMLMLVGDREGFMVMPRP